MSRDWHEGYDFCDGSNHGDQGSDNGKQGNLVNIRSETEKDEGEDLKISHHLVSLKRLNFEIPELSYANNGS